MYKIILTIAVALIIPLQLLAAPKDWDIRFTVHNFAYNPNVGVTYDANGITDGGRNFSANNPNVTEVCIFCHTPHNSSPASPLWNKYVDTNTYPGQPGAYKLYTSSSTLSSTAKHTASITAGSDSMLCLSCHDGKTAVNVIHNTKNYNSTQGADYIIDMSTVSGNTGPAPAWSLGDIGALTYTANIGATRKADGTILDAYAGTNLQDDHPVGFSYSGALADKPNDLNTIVAATAKVNGMGVRFFGPSDRLECGSCHDPHVFYGSYKSGGSRLDLGIPGTTAQQRARTPFLVRDNSGSALCLACHKK